MRFDESRWSYAFLGLIMVLAAYVRLDDLAGMGIAFDEPQHIFGALSYLDSGRPILPSGNEYSRAFLYTWSVAQSFRWFGDSLFTARLPGVLCGILTVLLLFVVGKRFFGPGVGLVASFALAILPFEVVWSRTTRMYAMYQLFFLFTVYAFYRGFETSAEPTRGQDTGINRFINKVPILAEWDLRWGWLTLAGVTLWIAVGLHVLGLAIGAGFMAYAGVMTAGDVATTGRGRGLWRSRYLWLVAMGVLFCFVYLIVLGHLGGVTRAIGFNPPWIRGAESTPLYYFDFLTSRGLLPIGVLFIIGSLQTLSRPTSQGLYVLVMAVVPLLFHSLAVEAQRPRYIYDIFPLVVLISAVGVTNLFVSESAHLAEWLKDKVKIPGRRRFLTRIGLGAVFLFSLGLIWPSFRAGVSPSGMAAQNYGGLRHTDWTAACEFLQEHRVDGDEVVATIPLAAQYSGCGDVHFTLDNGEIDQFEPDPAGGLSRHPFSAGPAITNREEFETVVTAVPRVWLLMDQGRFNNPSNVPDEIRRSVLQHAELRWTDREVSVFEWRVGVGVPGAGADSGRGPEPTVAFFGTARSAP